jgi:hypothetical protein
MKSMSRSTLALCAAIGTAALLLGCDAQRALLTGETSSGAPTPISCRLRISTCVPVVIPPRVAEMSDYTAVALVPDATPASGAIATQLEASMSKVRVNDVPFYNVLPAGDAGRQVSFEISASPGKLVETHGVEQHPYCPDTTISMSMCKNAQMRPVACTQREVALSVTVRVRTKAGKVVATRNEASSGKSALCFGDSGVLLDGDQLLAAAADKVLTAIVQDLVVRTEVVQVLARDDAPEVKDPERQQRFKEAVAFLKAGRLDRSCPVFQELSEIEGSSIGVLYNTAFCVQTKGDWCGANALYRRADALTHTPDSDLSNRINETQQSCLAQNKG